MGLWQEHGDALTGLAVYGLGIAIYTLAVAVLYVPMGTRMMLARKHGDARVATAGRRFVYVLFFPLASFLFFLVIAASMLFMSSLSDSELAPNEVMTIAMAVVLAIRICAYFSETAAADLARVMPLSMLAVVLVTNGLSDLKESLANLRAFRDDAQLLALFFLVVVFVEFFLRIVYEALGRPGTGKPMAETGVPRIRR